jgi:uncharacterized SAM-binding protein YcdF (DUF218 family)
MSVDAAAYYFFSTFLLPPGLGITLVAILGIACLFLRLSSRTRTVARFLFVFSLCLAYALTTPVVGNYLAALVEGSELHAQSIEALNEVVAKPEGPSVIVILGGGLRVNPKDNPDIVTLHARSSLRVGYGAFLAKSVGLPILVAGGIGAGFDTPESVVMARTLKNDYGLEAKWLEGNSRTTAENASYSAIILKAHQVKKIVLVTQAYHMRRSALAFEAQGIEVVMAPCGFLSGTNVSQIVAYLPSLSGIEAVFATSHELVGLLYYRFKGYITRLAYKA